MTTQTSGNTHGLRYEAEWEHRASYSSTMRVAKQDALATKEYRLPRPAAPTSKAVLVDNIKNAIIELVYSANELPSRRNSDRLSQRLNYDYTYLANVFSEVTGSTIVRCIIAHKIRRAKELLLQDEFNLSQIAYQLHYSSVAHLSGQFKKVTGLTPTAFKTRRVKAGIIPDAVNDVNPFCKHVKGPKMKRVSFVS